VGLAMEIKSLIKISLKTLLSPDLYSNYQPILLNLSLFN